MVVVPVCLMSATMVISPARSNDARPKRAWRRCSASWLLKGAPTEPGSLDRSIRIAARRITAEC